jgi:hypothetical protein
VLHRDGYLRYPFNQELTVLGSLFTIALDNVSALEEIILFGYGAS